MSAEYNCSQKNFNVNQMTKRAKLYTKRMSKSCTWGGQIELQVLGPIIHNYGYKGIKVYNADTRKILMKSPFSKTKNPFIHIILHGVNSGGTHYNFWNKPIRKKLSSVK